MNFTRDFQHSVFNLHFFMDPNPYTPPGDTNSLFAPFPFGVTGTFIEVFPEGTDPVTDWNKYTFQSFNGCYTILPIPMITPTTDPPTSIELYVPSDHQVYISGSNKYSIPGGWSQYVMWVYNFNTEQGYPIAMTSNLGVFGVNFANNVGVGTQNMIYLNSPLQTVQTLSKSSQSVNRFFYTSPNYLYFQPNNTIPSYQIYQTYFPDNERPIGFVPTFPFAFPTDPIYSFGVSNSATVVYGNDNGVFNGKPALWFNNDESMQNHYFMTSYGSQFITGSSSTSAFSLAYASNANLLVFPLNPNVSNETFLLADFTNNQFIHNIFNIPPDFFFDYPAMTLLLLPGGPVDSQGYYPNDGLFIQSKYTTWSRSEAAVFVTYIFDPEKNTIQPIRLTTTNIDFSTLYPQYTWPENNTAGMIYFNSLLMGNDAFDQYPFYIDQNYFPSPVLPTIGYIISTPPFGLGLTFPALPNEALRKNETVIATYSPPPSFNPINGLVQYIIPPPPPTPFDPPIPNNSITDDLWNVDKTLFNTLSFYIYPDPKNALIFKHAGTSVSPELLYLAELSVIYVPMKEVGVAKMTVRSSSTQTIIDTIVANKDKLAIVTSGTTITSGTAIVLQVLAPDGIDGEIASSNFIYYNWANGNLTQRTYSSMSSTIIKQIYGGNTTQPLSNILFPIWEAKRTGIQENFYHLSQTLIDTLGYSITFTPSEYLYSTSTLIGGTQFISLGFKYDAILVLTFITGMISLLFDTNPNLNLSPLVPKNLNQRSNKWPVGISPFSGLNTVTLQDLLFPPGDYSLQESTVFVNNVSNVLSQQNLSLPFVQGYINNVGISNQIRSVTEGWLTDYQPMIYTSEDVSGSFVNLIVPATTLNLTDHEEQLQTDMTTISACQNLVVQTLLTSNVKIVPEIAATQVYSQRSATALRIAL